MKPATPLQRIRARLRGRFGVPGMRRASPAVARWFQTPLGRALLARERAVLARGLQDLFGYHLLQVSVDPALDLTSASRISHRMTLSVRQTESTSLSQLVAEEGRLPLPSESVDLVVLHHSLDFSRSPHQILREAHRVLIPRGHLVVVGFNPWSSFGVAASLARLVHRHSVWRARRLRLGRLLDWLELLDLEPGRIERGFFHPPWSNSEERLERLDRWGRALHLPGGAFYMVVACKEVAGAVPIRPSWRSDGPPLPGLAVQKTSKCRQSNSDRRELEEG